MILSLLLLLVSISFQPTSAATDDLFVFGVSTDNSKYLPYFLLIFVFSLNVGTPIVKWLWLNYLSHVFFRVRDRLAVLGEMFYDRAQNANKRMQERMRV